MFESRNYSASECAGYLPARCGQRDSPFEFAFCDCPVVIYQARFRVMTANGQSIFRKQSG